MSGRTGIGRREMLRLTVLGTGLSLLAACAPPAPVGKPATAVPPPPAPTQAVAAPTAVVTAGATTGPAVATPAAGAPVTAAPGTSAPAAADKPGRDLVGRIEGPTVILDPSQYPKTLKEAPDLAELVKAGKLPPVAERIGQDPLVVKPLQEIGQYGGTLRRAFIGPTDRQNANRFAAGPDNLLYFDYAWKKVIPNIAREFEVQDGGRTTVLRLRRGMKWSDGSPFTADDIVFWYEDLYQHRQVVTSPHPSMAINGKQGIVEKVDDTTVKFAFADPNPIFPEVLSGWTALGGLSLQGFAGLGGFAPKQYTQQFHPKYVPQDQLDRLAKEKGFDNWVGLLKNQLSWHLNPDLPVLSPWRVTSAINNPVWTLERNSYSIWVDTDGNQLPYIDKIQMGLAENLEVLNLRVIAGEIDVQDRHVDMQKLPVLLDARQKGGFRVFLDIGQNGGDFCLRVNLSYEADPEIGDLLRTTDFRRALSLGIDRDQINEATFLGTGTPSSAVPADENKYFPGPDWRRKWATLDVQQANDLLDKMGLTKKDGEGYRLRKDGVTRLRLEYVAAAGSNADYTRMGEMVRDHWRRIGIELNVVQQEGTLVTRRAIANELQFWGIANGGSEDLFTSPDSVFPFTTTGPEAALGVLYAKWLQSSGREGKEPPAAVKQVQELWSKGLGLPEAERIKAGQEIWKLAADEVFVIGVIGMGPAIQGVRVAKNNIGNMPSRVVNATAVKSTTNALPQTFFFKG
jgi:peptide/nickel transport system substrate-binding protein